MKNNTTLLYTVLLILGDFFALVAAFVLAYIIRVKFDPRPLIEQIPALTYLRTFVTVLPLWIIVHALLGLYSPRVYEKRFSEIGRLLVGSFLGILVLIGYDFIVKDALFPARLVPLYGLVLAFALLLIVRTILKAFQRYMFTSGQWINRVLLVGTTSATLDLCNWLYSPGSGYKVVGVVGDYQKNELPKNIKHFDSLDVAIKSIGKNTINSIIQTELFQKNELNDEVLDYAQTHHIAYRFAPGNVELFTGKLEVELFRASMPLIAVHQTALIGWGKIAKRVFDLLFSVGLLIVLSPVLLIIALLLFIFDPGTIFFKQARLTRYGTTFYIYKFRTMKRKFNGLSPEDAFAKMGKPELIEKYRSNGDQLKSDPRISTIGRFLRRWSLDELPQLFNVVKGDLSMVGPRALVPEEINQAEHKKHILSVKSGITGLAQVSGRRDIDFAERRKLDVYYVQNWSFWLDIAILAKTLFVVLARKGAK